jgi:hypothetical protein
VRLLGEEGWVVVEEAEHGDREAERLLEACERVCWHWGSRGVAREVLKQ